MRGRAAGRLPPGRDRGLTSDGPGGRHDPAPRRGVAGAGRERRPLRDHRPDRDRGHLPVAERALPVSREPDRPAGPGGGVHAAGHERGVRAAARRHRPVRRVRLRDRRGDHRGTAHRVPGLALVGGGDRRPAGHHGHRRIAGHPDRPAPAALVRGDPGRPARLPGGGDLDPRPGRDAAHLRQRHQRPGQRLPDPGRQLARHGGHRRRVRGGHHPAGCRAPDGRRVRRRGRAPGQPDRGQGRWRGRGRPGHRRRRATPTAASSARSAACRGWCSSSWASCSPGRSC